MTFSSNLKRHNLPVYLLLTFLTYSNFAHSKEAITWRVTDWPPFYILDGVQKGRGIYDEMIKMLSDKMPEYDHQTVQMNTDRVRKAWSRGNNVCHPSVLPDNNPDIKTSVYNSVLLPHRIIFNKEQEIANVSLMELLKDVNIVGGITPGRYSKKINKIIDDHQEKDHLKINTSYKSLIGLLFSKRIDYIIEYSPIIEYYARQHQLANITHSVAIQETAESPFLLVAIACTKNPWGEKIIAKINKILIEEANKPNYLDFRLKWFDEASQQELKLIYANQYLKDKH